MTTILANVYWKINLYLGNIFNVTCTKLGQNVIRSCSQLECLSGEVLS